MTQTFQIIPVIVTQVDIEEGRPENSYHCPVAKALTRALQLGSGKYPQIEVASGSFKIRPWEHTPSNSIHYPLPNDIFHWIRMFDKGFEVWPISFEVYI